MVPIFTFNIRQRIHPNLVTLGEYDGIHPSLTFATLGGKVYVHNSNKVPTSTPSRTDLNVSTGDFNMLNINQTVTALHAGHLDASKDYEVLCIGSPTNLLCYDVENNKDLFYKEVSEGVSALTIGLYGSHAEPLAITGGNCAIEGFNAAGDDMLWTVTGDVVSSLILADSTGDGQNELIVGSEDFNIRIFDAAEQLVHEMTETDNVSCLCRMGAGKYSYALGNGTVGVYTAGTRLWRIKSKNNAVSILNYDINGDGVDELITGWSNGKIDARSEANGEVLFKDMMGSSVAGVVRGKYRGATGGTQLVACSIEGEVRGYSVVDALAKRAAILDGNVEQDTLRDLQQKKQNILLELRNYDSSSVPISGHGIPANTQLQTALSVGPNGVQLTVVTTNGTLIPVVLIFAEGIFDGECHVAHPSPNALSGCVVIPLAPPKDAPVDLHVKAFVCASRSSIQFQVFELTRQLPRFAMYAHHPTKNAVATPKGNVRFVVAERVKRLIIWLEQNFLMVEDIDVVETGDFRIGFTSLRGSGPLVISMSKVGNVVIHTDDMDLAGDIIQHLGSFLGIVDLQSSCDFPNHMANLKELLSRVDGLHSAREKMSADMADSSALIRAMVVKAEDARLLGDMKNMSKAYMELYTLNVDLISGYRIRSNNHQELVDCLRIVNQFIQKSANLRIGKYKTAVVSACRQAIKTNNLQALFKIIITGEG